MLNIQKFRSFIKKTAAIGLCAVCVLTGSLAPATTAFAANDTAATETTTKTIVGVITKSVSLRKGPTSDFAVVKTLSIGDVVKVKSRVWGTSYEVTATHEGKDYEGYVSASCVATAEEVPVSMERKTVPFPDQTGNTEIGKTYYTTSAVNLRASATAAADIVICLSKGDTCVVTASGMGWFQVVAVHNGKTYEGCVYGKYLTAAKATTTEETTKTVYPKTGYVNYDYLNVRAKASTTAKKVGKLYKSQSVTITSSSNGWYKIKYVSGTTTKTGYVSAKYISVSTKGKTNARVVLRKTAKATGTKITTLKSGKSVTVVSESKGWMKIKCTINSKTKTGYVMAEFIDM